MTDRQILGSIKKALADDYDYFDSFSFDGENVFLDNGAEFVVLDETTANIKWQDVCSEILREKGLENGFDESVVAEATDSMDDGKLKDLLEVDIKDYIRQMTDKQLENYSIGYRFQDHAECPSLEQIRQNRDYYDEWFYDNIMNSDDTLLHYEFLNRMYGTNTYEYISDRNAVDEFYLITEVLFQRGYDREWALGKETYLFDDEYGDSYYMYKVG